MYVRDVEASVHRPDKELKGFAKVHLAPGGSELVTVQLDRRSFAVWDVAAHDWLVESGGFDVVVARSSVDVVAVLAVVCITMHGHQAGAEGLIARLAVYLSGHGAAYTRAIYAGIA